MFTFLRLALWVFLVGLEPLFFVVRRVVVCERMCCRWGCGEGVVVVVVVIEKLHRSAKRRLPDPPPLLLFMNHP